MIISHSGRIFIFNFKAVIATVFKLNKYKNNWKLNYKVGIAVMKGTKARVVLMVTKTKLMQGDIPTSTFQSSMFITW